MPAIVLTGARQTGKSTLAGTLLPGDRRLLSLDELDVLEIARREPDRLTAGSEPVTIDEVQRAPDLLLAVKRAIDRNRIPGQFLLTGSANLLVMNRVSESLAGRASYLTLWPLTRREQKGLGRCGLWEELLAADESEWIGILESDQTAKDDWRALARRGGFPTPALQLRSHGDRGVWFDGYVRTYLERDLQAVSSISALPDFRRLMQAVSFRLGALLNQSELGRDVALPQPTVHRYLNLLETTYMLIRVPAYAVNRTKRLIKSPKAYFGDTGLALHVAGVEEPTGAHLENLVLLDLMAWRDSRTERAEILHWRTTVGNEVDFVIEANGRLVPIEIKAADRPRMADADQLRLFRAEYGRKARAGLLLHGGTKIEWITPDVLAAPWWRVC